VEARSALLLEEADPAKINDSSDDEHERDAEGADG
jgi:hypothetical protein